MAFSFPYPSIGTVVRPPGQGCKNCVHQLLCPALYWFKRYTFKEPDDNSGRACTSWSSDPSTNPTEWTDDDFEENKYMFLQGIGSEPNRNGIGEFTTGGSRQSEGT
jgi:hypothetical protein